MTYRHFNNESTRSSVLRAVANTENEAAWQRLFDLYAGFVFSIARSKGLKEEDADDIVQIVFTDLARNLPTFQYDRAKGRFRSYLAGLVHWRVTDRLKAGKRDMELKANWRGRTPRPSCGSTVFPATTSTRSASASPRNCARQRRLSLPRWTLPMRPILRLDRIGDHRYESVFVVLVEPRPLSVGV